MKFRAGLCFVLSLSPGITLAQTGSAPDSATLQSLLTEVRQLRVTLERTMMVWPQMQLLLQRAQLQQQRVESVSRQLEQLRDQLARSAADSGRLAAEVKRTEEILTEEQDARRRRDIEINLKRIKAVSEEQATRDQQQQARESQLDGQLQGERAKLNELNDRLDALERVLQAPPSSK